MVSTRKRKAEEDLGPCEPEPRRSTRGVNKHKKDDALVAHLKSSEQNPAASDEPSSSVTTRSFYKSGKLKRTNDHVNVWDLAPPPPAKPPTPKKANKITAVKTDSKERSKKSEDQTEASTSGNQKTQLNGSDSNTASTSQDTKKGASKAPKTTNSKMPSGAAAGAEAAALEPRPDSICPVHGDTPKSPSKGKGVPGKKSKAKSSAKKKEIEEDKVEPAAEPGPEPGPDLPPYYTPVPGACSIEDLSDEMILNIFTLLDSKTLQKSVTRISKRWNSLSKDKSLWRVVDLTSKALGPTQARKAIKQYCNNKFTTSLSLRAINKRTHRKRVTVHKCISAAVVKEMKKVCDSLKSFSISYEQIFKVDVFSALPATLTHLSLPYCNLSMEHFKTILSSDFRLNSLKYLDLSGVFVLKLELYGLDDTPYNLPKSLTTLKLRDSLISLQDYTIIRLIKKHKALLELDISLHNIAIEYLRDLSDGLENLETLNMAGCLVCDEDASPTRDEDVEDDEWFGIWQNGFNSIDRLNVRNVQQNSGELMAPLRHTFRHFGPSHMIDTNGFDTLGDWTWDEQKVDYRERDKFDHDERCQKERDEEYRSFGWGWGWRRRGWGLHDDYSDSDSYYDSDGFSDDSSHGPRGDECSVM